MLYIREWRLRLVLVWLFCQVGSIALAAAPLPRTAATNSAEVTTCTCPGDHPDQACPMHQSGGGANSDDCSMRSALGPTDAALLSLGTGLGIPADASIAIGPASARSINVVAVVAAGVTDVPDFPPPRL